MKVDVVNTQKQKTGDIDLDDSVFAAPIKPWLFYEVVKMQMANRRAGTQSTKTTSEVRGSGKKPFRQKGTGRARQGSTRAAHMRGGGVVLGPKPRSYEYHMPKKMVKGALRSALSQRAHESNLIVISGWAPAAPKTKEAVAIFERFGAKKVLVVDSRENINLMKSVRNLPHVKYLPVEALNVYDVLNHDHLFLAEGVVQPIVERLKTSPSRREQELAQR